MVKVFSDFINFLNRHHILEKLRKIYRIEKEEVQSIIESIRDQFQKRSAKKLKPLEFYKLIEKVFFDNFSLEKRKGLGEIYTPLNIVENILNVSGYRVSKKIENKYVIDLSCGAGSFLVSCCKRLRNRVLKNKDFNKNVEQEESENFVSILKKYIYGIDINSIACFLCQLNLYYLTFDILKKLIQKNPNYEIPVYNIINRDSITLFSKKNSLKLNQKDFNYVFGNPPYLFIRDIPTNLKKIIENSILESNQGQFDYYQLFIEMGIKLLRNKGTLGYIVPDSLLALSNRNYIRKYIYNNSKIKEIHIVGDKFHNLNVSNIIIILEKTLKHSNNEKNIIKIKNSNLKVEKENLIPQKRILDWNYKFLVHLSEMDMKILNHLNSNFRRIKDLIKNQKYEILINRGVELGKKGRVIYCKNCKFFQPVPRGNIKKCSECGKKLLKEGIKKIVLSQKPSKNSEKYKKFLISMERYRIKQVKFIKCDIPGINYKDPESYKDRIIIRQINQDNLICATYYSGEIYASQSFYNLKLQKPIQSELNPYYLLGLINSELLSYYFFKTFGSYKNLFPRILIEKIKILPIKIPRTKKEIELSEIITNNVRNLLRDYEKNTNFLYSKEEKISEYVFELYNIPFNERKFIRSELNCF